MKIIIPNIAYPDNFEDNVAFTLRKMGHDVLTMPLPLRILNDKARHLLSILTDKLIPNRFSLQEKWLIHSIKNFKPDMVLCLTQSLKEEVLAELKKQNIITICWWGDTAANMTRQGLLCEGWDFVYIKDRFAVQKLRSLNLNAFHLVEAMNPAWHNKYMTTPTDAIVFAGNTYEYRHLLLRKLVDKHKYNITLYGNHPPKWAHPSISGIYQNKYIVKEEKSRVFGNGAACINSTSMTEFDSLNCRAFEIAGAAGMQILEYRPAVEECFDLDKEIMIYRSLDELEVALDKAIRYTKDVSQIRENGYIRAHSEHTYELRLEKIFKALN